MGKEVLSLLLDHLVIAVSAGPALVTLLAGALALKTVAVHAQTFDINLLLSLLLSNYWRLLHHHCLSHHWFGCSHLDIVLPGDVKLELICLSDSFLSLFLQSLAV